MQDMLQSIGVSRAITKTRQTVAASAAASLPRGSIYSAAGRAQASGKAPPAPKQGSQHLSCSNSAAGVHCRSTVAVAALEPSNSSSMAAPTQISANKVFGGYNRRYKHASSTLGCDMTFTVYFPPGDWEQTGLASYMECCQCKLVKH